MNTICRFAIAAFALAAPIPAVAAAIPAVMYKNPSCSCCESYAAYLETNGFKVEIIPSDDLAAVSTSLGVPDKIQGCHSVKIGNYVVEGFVPVDAINKMLGELPKIAGIAVIGMPPGSPVSMGPKTEPFKIFSFLTNGETKVYAVE